MAASVVQLKPVMREAALDLDALEALEQALGAHLCREIVEDAILQTTERLATLETALVDEDWGKIRKMAHDLVSLPGQIGMSAVSAQARALLGCCRDHDHVGGRAVAHRLLRSGRSALLACNAEPF